MTNEGPETKKYVHRGTPHPIPETPAGVRSMLDIAYGADDRQKYDVYIPEGAEGPLPVVVFVHGGAYVRRDKRAIRVMHVLEHGFALVSIGYRLATTDKFPAQIQDVNDGLSHLVAHAEDYGIDPERLVLTGASAGAHLVNLAALARDVEDFHPSRSARIRGVVSIYGVSDLLSMSAPMLGGVDHDAPDAPARDLLGASVDERPDLARRASPITYVSPDAPPFLLLHGDQDRVVPYTQSTQLHYALRLAGADSKLVRLHGLGHGDPGFQTGNTAQLIRDFIGKHTRAE